MDTLILAGAVGWGLLAIGGLQHLLHLDRLRELLQSHTDHASAGATTLVTVELLLAVAIPTAWFGVDAALLPAVAAAAVLGLGFTVWIGVLLARRSPLPCACSFGTGPTNRWSLLRAALVIPVGCLGLVGEVDLTQGTVVSVWLVGLAVAGSVFVLPEALTWPDASRAILRRIDAHAPSAGGAGTAPPHPLDR